MAALPATSEPYFFPAFGHSAGHRGESAEKLGREESARLAAKACEGAYDAAMAGKLFGMTPEDVEGILEHERFMMARLG